METKTKALVTGGAGFIGSHLVDRLIELGYQVVVIDDFSLGKTENLAQHKNNPLLKIYKKSICEDLSSVFKKEKFDTVFHVAAKPSVQYSIDHPVESNDTNINGTLNILNLSKNFGVKRVVFTSSSAIYGDQRSELLTEDLLPNPMSPYALHKLTGEYYAGLFFRLYGLETISLRYFNVFGPRQDPTNPYSNLIPKFMKFAIDGKVPKINGDGKQKRDFIYVADIIEANILASTTEDKECFGQFFNVGRGKSTTVNEMTKKIFLSAGSDIKPTHGPALIEPRATLASLKKIKKLMGWSPKYTLDEGLGLLHESLM
jgi:nucleoside-diphosphate-sugar epimerase